VFLYVTLHAREGTLLFSNAFACGAVQTRHLFKKARTSGALTRAAVSIAGARRSAARRRGKKHNMENSALERTHITYPSSSSSSERRKVRNGCGEGKITFRPAARAHIKFADREIKWEAFSGRQ